MSEVCNLLWLSLTSITTEDWTGLHLSGLDWMALYFTRLDYLRLRLISPDSTTLQYPGLKRKAPYSTTVYCTSLEWSAWNCTACFLTHSPRNGLILSCSNSISKLTDKKCPLSFYILSCEQETTLTLMLYYNISYFCQWKTILFD